MKFWEAMKALEEDGKKVRKVGQNNYLYYNRDRSKGPYGVCTNDGGNAYIYEFDQDSWEIVEEPELYWQWRFSTGKILESLFTQDKIKVGQDEANIKYSRVFIEKHAGPWIKTENGFKKTDNWEQF